MGKGSDCGPCRVSGSAGGGAGETQGCGGGCGGGSDNGEESLEDKKDKKKKSFNLLFAVSYKRFNCAGNIFF